MELLLLKLVAVSRPIGSIRHAAGAFDVIGLGLFGLLIVGGLVSLALRRAIRMSAVDWTIVAITIWVISGYAIYFDVARIADAAKLLVPMLSYILVKNIVRDQVEYARLLMWIVVGFVIPVAYSTVLIATGSSEAVQYVSYWTDLPRWQGAYVGSHNMGHSMTLLLITMVTYWTVRNVNGSTGASAFRLVSNSFLVALGAAALYCLYMSQVRTAIAGLLIFGLIYLYHYNKRLLMFGAGVVVIAAVGTASHWAPALVPELAMQERGVQIETGDLGSGRGRMWASDLAVFAELPIDQQLAGMGIGNRKVWGPGDTSAFMGDGDETHGHNDWLEMLTQTGLIGFALFVALQILLFRAILRLDRKERFVFLAMLVAVNVMMFFSNSYAWRIQVSHLYYIILAYVELRRPDRGIETVSASTAANVSGGPVEQRPTITRGTSHYRLGARDG